MGQSSDRYRKHQEMKNPSDGEFFKGDGGDEDVKVYGGRNDDNSGLVGRSIEKPSVDKKL